MYKRILNTGRIYVHVTLLKYALKNHYDLLKNMQNIFHMVKKQQSSRLLTNDKLIMY